MSVNPATIEAKVLVFREVKAPLECICKSDNIENFINAWLEIGKKDSVQKNATRVCIVFTTPEHEIGEEGSEQLKNTFTRVKKLNFGDFANCRAPISNQTPETYKNKYYWIPKNQYPDTMQIPADALTDSSREEKGIQSSHTQETDNTDSEEESPYRFTLIVEKADETGGVIQTRMTMSSKSEEEFFKDIIDILDSYGGVIKSIKFKEGSSIPERLEYNKDGNYYIFSYDQLQKEREKQALLNNDYVCTAQIELSKSGIAIISETKFIVAKTQEEFVQKINEFSKNKKTSVRLYFNKESKIPDDLDYDNTKKCYIFKISPPTNNNDKFTTKAMDSEAEKDSGKQHFKILRNFFKRLKDFLCCWRKPKK